MENKKTKKVFFTEVKAILEDLQKDELVDFINHELELLDKKAMSRKAGTTKKNQENEALTELIVSELEAIGKSTLTDLLKKSSALQAYTDKDGRGLSNQRITALLKPLILSETNPNGIIIREVVKKMVLFSVSK